MATNEGTQHKISRVRPPRVQITYDVETGGAQKKVELPLVVGILADLSGQRDPEVKLPPMKDRKFVAIDRDNFPEVMKAIAPRIQGEVKDTITKVEEGEEQPTRSFVLDYNAAQKTLDTKYEEYKEKLTDRPLGFFDPINVVRADEKLRKLYDTRKALSDLLAKIDGNDKLDDLLDQVARQTEDEQKKLQSDVKAAGAPEGE